MIESLELIQRGGGGENKSHDYGDHLARLKSLWEDMPTVAIDYRDLSVSFQVPENYLSVKTVGSMLLHLPNLIWDKLAGRQTVRTFNGLFSCSGLLKPGTMCLILAPPGAGKTLLLKALAGQLHGDAKVSGKVRYNGYTKEELLQNGIHVDRLSSYVDQIDSHMPLMTVKETFQFAYENSVPDPALLGDSSFVEADKKRVDLMVNLLGLHECADTILGDALVRGVSGGQKKRVSIGEMMISNSRALFLDEISTGLDAAATYDITKTLCEWSTQMNGIVVSSLLQPAPEVVAMFDHLILMREGRIVFDGPTEQILPYLESLGFRCPPNQDLADYLVNFLADPAASYRMQLAREPHDAAVAVAAATRDEDDESNESKEQLAHVLPKCPPSAKDMTLSTAELADAYQKSPFSHECFEALKAQEAMKRPEWKHENLSVYSKSQYGGEYPHSYLKHMMSNLKRQGTLIGRNKQLLGPRIGQSIFMSLVMGTLYLNLATEDYSGRIGLALFAVIFGAFGNMQEVPIATAAKRVVQKQIMAGFFPTLSYIFSVVTVHMPLACIESFIFGTILYWLSGFVYDAGRYFFFVLVLLCNNLTMSVIFRSITYFAKNQDVAQMMAGPTTSIFLLFGGFLITQNNIPNFLIWVYWLSPFSWSVRSISLNEFGSSRYDHLINNGASYVRAGDFYLDQWQITTNQEFKWAGIGFLVGCFFFFVFLSAFVLRNSREILNIGTKRINDEAGDTNNTDKRHATVHANGNGSANDDSHSTMLFKPVTVTFRNLKYTVFIGKKDPLVLLQGINGYARPGTLTALMGSSGAGKTTLMDVIAGRKTSGKIEGEVLMNGFPVVKKEFGRITGYVEQQDLHVGTATVRETLMFSARLRLPPEISDTQRIAFVEEILDVLELREVADRLVGDVTLPGLSPGQLKRVTIGVELAANPTVLFLDEPTTSLDSRAALVVMRVIKRIAVSGRTVVCTIHQPSAELFAFFDRLLLLKSGGHEVFFGDLGENCEHLVQYFENYNPKMPRTANPAVWMLDVIGAGIGDKDKDVHDYVQLYKDSQLKATAINELNLACQPLEGDTQMRFDSEFAQPFHVQFQEVLLRTSRSYWRDVTYNFTRWVLLAFLGAIFGLVYLQLEWKDFAGVQSKISVMYMTSAFNGVINASTALPVLSRFRAIFYREKASNTYSSFAYSISIGIVELPYIFVGCFLFVISNYFMVGHVNDGTLFFKYLLAHYLLSLCFNFWGQFLVSALPNIIVTNIVQGIFFSFMFLFGGVFIQARVIVPGWKWFYYLNPVPKALIALVVPQLRCYDELSKCPSIYTPANGQLVQMPVQEFVLRYLDTNLDSYWPMIGWLLLTLFVMRVFVSFSLHKIAHIKR